MKTDRVERFIALARASLTWERVWPALWPASGVLGLYVAAALFDLFAIVPAWLHLLLLIAALVATGWLVYLPLRAFAWPQWHEGARRLERDSGLEHRPITERDDVIAAGKGDGWAEALWRAHVRRLLARIKALRVRLPSPGLAEKDPYALRFVVLLLLVAGLVFAGRDWSRRLAEGFLPTFEASAPTARLDAWINPPAYTGEAPLYLKRGASLGAPISAPQGSKLVLRVHGADASPQVRVTGGAQAPFKGHDGEFAADYVLDKSGNITVNADGRTLGNWHIRVVPDSPPVIAFSAPPSRTLRNAVKFAFTAGDDYGIVKARAIIVPVNSKAKKPLTVELPIDNPRAKTLTQTVYEDLTENPYAGLKVKATLEAVDGAGQIGKSKPAIFTLPERVFTNPLARALVEQRQHLAVGDIAAVPSVQRTLDALTIAPQRFYADRKGVYTAIRAAYWGLRSAHVRADVERVESLLWQTALALEQGGLAQAAEQLRRLQQMLSQALESGAPQEKIDELLQRYKQALNKYLQMLAQNAQNGNGPIPSNAKVLSRKDLDDLLNAIEQMAKTGSRNQAAQALAMLQSLLENLHMNAGPGGGGQQSPKDKAKSDAVKKLGDLMGRQRELLDKTYRQDEDEGNPKDGGGKGLARQQGQIKKQLEQILKGLGDQKIEAPKSLGEAGRSMGEAQGELGQKDFDSAGDAQKDALEGLRKGAGELAQSMMNNGQAGAQGANQDPFGRREGSRGALGSGNLDLPDKSTMERAREILKELRKRAAERGRPKEELDYIDRLLKQF